MRFSDAFLRQVRDRVSLADYAGRRLSWDKRKTRPSAGDYWACCPFHQEKTPSFHVLDQKGIYNCFGCGEKGDLFTLAMKLEGLSFPEAVEQMTELAGMELPKDDYADRGQSDRRKRLIQAAARAAKLYREALMGREGREARDYLAGRGFDADLCERFGIGYAPGGWSWLLDKLRGDFKLDELLDAGLVREGQEGRGPHDTFVDRVTFEIADPSGKVIAFGGRALSSEVKAKYINSPENQLYSKSRVLYRLKQARELLAKTKADGFVVGEGYLDVIAFERAGIAAVAPCGTAVTEEQLQLLWRGGGEPVLCFDGDDAGTRAAERALDLALPHLGPGRTIRIAYAPQGQDPDDIFRDSGPDALAALVAAAAPASDALFAREQARHDLATPESQAAFQAALKEAINRIADRDTQRAYFSDLMSRAAALLRERRPKRENRKDNWRGPQTPVATPELKAITAAPRPRPAAENFLRAAVDHPLELAQFSDWLDRLDFADPDLAQIRDVLVRQFEHGSPAETIDREALNLHLTRLGHERAAARLKRWPTPRPGAADSADLETQWLALATREVVLPAIKEELDELRAGVAAGDDAAFARFQALSREARAIEARARESRHEELSDDSQDEDQSQDSDQSGGQVRLAGENR